MPKRLYLLRHGQTDANILDTVQGRLPDLPLNSTGEKQAELTAEALSEVNFNRIYMSPALRARQTAQKIFERHIPTALAETYPNFNEINFGDFEGRTFSKIEELYPDLLKTYREKPSQCVFPRGESMIEAYERAGRTINTIIINHPHNESVLIVSHGGIITLIFIYLFDLDMDKMFHAIKKHHNCSLSIIDFESYAWNTPLSKPHIVCFNDISHLKEEHDKRLRNII